MNNIMFHENYNITQFEKYKENIHTIQKTIKLIDNEGNNIPLTQFDWI